MSSETAPFLLSVSKLIEPGALKLNLRLYHGKRECALLGSHRT